MNDLQAIWRRTFASFAGPGISQPSDMMRVGDDEADLLLAGLEALEWRAPVYVGSGRHAAYTVCNACNACASALLCAGTIVGFYRASYLWIAREHRGLGLSTPLILAAAGQRGGSIVPPGVVMQGYTPEGVAVHRAAHTHAVLTAVVEGLPVPAVVLDEIGVNCDKSLVAPASSGCLR